MSEGYKIVNQQGIHFLTFTIVQWADIFTRQIYRDIVIESFNFCIEKKGLLVHAWVIMSNHVHCILSAPGGNLSGIIRDMKSFTSKKITREIRQVAESRRDWLLMISRYAAGGHARNDEFQVWTHDNHPEELYSMKFIRQKLDYIHLNPVKAGLVHEPHHWIYSSAADYFYSRQMGPVKISLLDL
jgi:REP element-mobilizing transposase RayT